MKSQKQSASQPKGNRKRTPRCVVDILEEAQLQIHDIVQRLEGKRPDSETSSAVWDLEKAREWLLNVLDDLEESEAEVRFLKVTAPKFIRGSLPNRLHRIMVILEATINALRPEDGELQHHLMDLVFNLSLRDYL